MLVVHAGAPGAGPRSGICPVWAIGLTTFVVVGGLGR